MTAKKPRKWKAPDKVKPAPTEKQMRAKVAREVLAGTITLKQQTDFESVSRGDRRNNAKYQHQHVHVEDVEASQGTHSPAEPAAGATAKLPAPKTKKEKAIAGWRKQDAKPDTMTSAETEAPDSEATHATSVERIGFNDTADGENVNGESGGMPVGLVGPRYNQTQRAAAAGVSGARRGDELRALEAWEGFKVYRRGYAEEIEKIRDYAIDRRMRVPIRGGTKIDWLAYEGIFPDKAFAAALGSFARNKCRPASRVKTMHKYANAYQQWMLYLRAYRRAPDEPAEGWGEQPHFFIREIPPSAPVAAPRQVDTFDRDAAAKPIHEGKGYRIMISGSGWGDAKRNLEPWVTGATVPLHGLEAQMWNLAHGRHEDALGAHERVAPQDVTDPLHTIETAPGAYVVPYEKEERTADYRAWVMFINEDGTIDVEWVDTLKGRDVGTDP